MRQVLEMALEALEDIKDDCSGCEFEWSNDYPLQAKAHAAIKEALTQPEQDDGMCRACENDLCTAKQGCVALDNPPPQRTWVGLTDEEVARLAHHELWVKTFIRKIEEKLRSKNT